MLLEGIFLPLTTPFYPDGRLYVRKLEHNIDRYSRTPAAGMFVLGSAGEAEGLTDDEVRTVLMNAIGAAAKTKVMIAGVGRASVFASLALTEMAATADYDAVAVRAPEFFADPSMRTEVITYFQAIADRSPLPVVLISDRERPLEIEILLQLASHPQVVGVIEDHISPERTAQLVSLTSEVRRDVVVTTLFAAVTRRMLHVADAESDGTGRGNFVSAASLGGDALALALMPPVASLKTRIKRVGFQVLAGSSGGMLDAWTAGAVGAVPRLGACAPQACCEVYQAFKDGDGKLAQEKQLRVSMAARHMEGWSGVAALKYGCDLNAYFGGRPRLPLIAPNAEQRATIEHELKSLRN